jgi:bacteriocin-like protein
MSDANETNLSPDDLQQVPGAATKPKELSLEELKNVTGGAQVDYHLKINDIHGESTDDR